MMDPATTSLTEVQVERIGDVGRRTRDDAVVTERPLEIRVLRADLPAAVSVAVTMRTPGHDDELAVGFLRSEGLVSAARHVRAVHRDVVAPGVDGDAVRVTLSDDAPFDPERLRRAFYATSSCGVCGTARLEDLHVPAPEAVPTRTLPHAQVLALPARLRAAQPLFDACGGLHGAALVGRDGELIAVREDVGRHNAVDQLVGRTLLDGLDVADATALVLSGRVSFELMQKALVLGVPFVVAVGAPSSLAVSVARAHGATLVGFVRDARYNVYAGAARIAELPEESQP